MPQITRALLRKRSEHNEGMISTLEEVTLHQEELEGINEVLGATCRKLKILYLQNNIIPKMENLVHLKELQYLNLALNNITKIEGLQNCESLNKLDLTVNFIDVDELEASIDHLASRECLRDLYMMGNPSQTNWPNFNSYVIARLPQLQTLDGTEITKSMQIIARQQLPHLEKELRELAAAKRAEKAAAAANQASSQTDQKKSTKIGGKDERSGAVFDADTITSADSDVIEAVDVEDDENDGEAAEEELTENTPEVRVQIYKELAEQKKEKEDRENANKPKERDYEKEQAERIAKEREKEEKEGEKDIKQRNEAGLDFKWDEESKPGHVILEVGVPKFLDSSLIDVDVHPTYISIIIKSKVLRLRLPAEVLAGQSKCQRSKTTGALLVIMPKVNPKENAITIRGDIKERQKTGGAGVTTVFKTGGTSSVGKKTSGSSSTTIKPKKLSLQEQMMLEAAASANGGSAVKESGGSGEREKLNIGIGGGSNIVKNIASIVPRKDASKDQELIPQLEKNATSPSGETPVLIAELD